jgi:alpha-L-rhamnosidase
MISPGSPARWIWCEGEARPKNFYLHLRKLFTIEADVRQAEIEITADSRYILFVNGVQVARGPARSDRRWQCLDRWDLTSFLRRGPNCIAVLVHHYGEWTFAYMLGRGGLLAAANVECLDGSRVLIGTDASWNVRRAVAWQPDLPRMSIQLGYPEVFDARSEFSGWEQPGYDAGNWESAEVLGPAGMEPWPVLVPRQIPAMGEVELYPGRVLDVGEVGPARTGYYVDLLRTVWSASNAVAYLTTYVWSPRDGNFEIHAGSQEAIKVWINGNCVVSNCVTRDPGPDQEIVTVPLHRGWNTALAKIVQGEGQWHFYFRMEGEDSDRLIYAMEKESAHDQSSPWWIIGPFESGEVEQGFNRVHPPEEEIDFSRTYTGKGGKEIKWVSAGVSRESALTSIVMSRERRIHTEHACLQEPAGLIQGTSAAVILPGAAHGVYAVIDFGKEVTGYPTVTIGGAEGGEIIDLGYGEVLQTPSGEIISPASGSTGIVNPDRAGVHYADRYICRAGTQRFQTFDKRAFRYLQIDIRNVRTPIRVGPVSLLFSTYPVEYAGAFACSDHLVNRIWETGRWSVQLSMEDAYADSPWRERAQWWGDVRLEALVAYYCFGDARLTAQGLRHIAQSQIADGLTRAIYPTEWEDGILPTYTMLWVISLHDHYMLTGDLDLLRELLPFVERAMSYFRGVTGPHGLLRDVPHWLFVDWAAVDTSGESAAVNALYFGTLVAASWLADACGVERLSCVYRGAASEVRSGMDRFLRDENTSCYMDTWNNGKRSGRISEQANIWAVAFGVATGEKARTIMQSVASLADVKVASPYFAFYALVAMARTGLFEQALSLIRTRWKPMLDWGATTWWETWEPKASFCHGWSSGPTYFLQSEILGVKPALPGWGEIHIEPHPVDIERVRGVVPTPHGPVAVSWTRSDSFVMNIDVPVPARIALPEEFGNSFVVMQNGALHSGISHEPGVFRLPAGSYRISSQP